MLNSRRHLLQSNAGFAGTLATAPLLFSQKSVPPPPQPRQSPNAPISQNVPLGLDGRPAEPPDQRTQNLQIKAQIKENVDKMYQMIGELKQESDLGRSDSILNISFVKKAEQIEKLAKQVKNIAKG
jgi:hypothetical protein